MQQFFVILPDTQNKQCHIMDLMIASKWSKSYVQSLCSNLLKIFKSSVWIRPRWQQAEGHPRQRHVRHCLRGQRLEHSDPRRCKGSPGKEPRRCPTPARRDHAALDLEAQEHRPVPRITLSRRLLQDHHGAGHLTYTWYQSSELS